MYKFSKYERLYHLILFNKSKHRRLKVGHENKFFWMRESASTNFCEREREREIAWTKSRNIRIYE